MVNIFTVATDIYKKYIDVLYKSLVNVYPNEEKRFILIADKPCCDCDIYYHICNLPYPFNTYHKIEYIADCINSYNIHKDEKFIFVDADSCFRIMPSDFWSTFDKFIDTNKLIFTKSPWQNTDIPNIENNHHKDYCHELYIDNLNPKLWTQTSFFAGKINKFLDLSLVYFEYVTNCTKLHRHVPCMPYMSDQTIMNKIISLNYSDYIIDDFIYNGYEFSFVDNDEYLRNDFRNKEYCNCGKTYELNKYHPYIFIIQKFNNDIKSSKRL